MEWRRIAQKTEDQQTESQQTKHPQTANSPQDRRRMQGMVMLELQVAVLVLGVGIGANLAIQNQALQRMLDSALEFQSAEQTVAPSELPGKLVF